jgi:hypothetical protein
LNELKELVRNIKYVTGKTLEVIAEEIGYSRSYLTDQINKGANHKLKEILLNQYPLKSEQNVSREMNKTLDSQNGITKDELYERLLAEKEISRKRAEEKEDALLAIIKDNLTALQLSSAKNQELLIKIWDEQTSDDLVIMGNQDEAAGNPEGTSAGKSDRNLLKLATERKRVQRKSETGKHEKAGK